MGCIFGGGVSVSDGAYLEVHGDRGILQVGEVLRAVDQLRDLDRQGTGGIMTFSLLSADGTYS